MMQQPSVYELARIKFRDEFKKGIMPIDGRQPIPDELAKTMVQELIDLEVSKDALIGIFDAFLILSTHLKEVGYTNLVLLENNHNNLSNTQETYYSNIQNICKKSGIKYYVPPVNDYNRCNMNFVATIGNPPYSDTSSDSTNTKSIDDEFFLSAIKCSDYVSMIIRSKHFCNQNSSFRKFLFKTGNISSIKYLPEDTFKGFIVRTCIVTFDRNHRGPTTIQTLNGSVNDILLTDDTIIHPVSGVLASPVNNLGSRWKRGKLHLNQIIETGIGVTFIKALGRRDGDIETCTIDPTLESFGYKRHGVLIPNMGTSDGGIGKVVVKPFDAVAGHSIVQFWTNTEEEALTLANYLQSDEVTELIKSIKFSNPNPKSLFSLIPDPLI